MGLLNPRQLLTFVAGLVLAGSMVSCAKDAGVTTPGGGGSAAADGGQDGSTGGGGATGDSGFPKLGFGSPCKNGSDCESGQCTDVGQTTPSFVCTTPCQKGQACAAGYCAFQPDRGYVCIPDNGGECAPCTTNADCSNIGDRCVASPKFDLFCARDCSFDGVCPSGFSCVAPDSYGPGGGAGPGDAGTSTGQDGGAGEAGPPTEPPRICVPDNGDSCPCGKARDGVKRTCEQTSGGLTCQGKETCNGSSGQWEGCTAGSPQPEVCDGADDNCDGVVDGNANGSQPPISQLCPSAAPAHSQWSCDKTKGTCVPNCDPGWNAYPATLKPSAGCICQDDKTEPNDTCAAASAEGSVSDADTTAITISGRLSSDSDEDWYKFATVDSDEGSTNSYHIKIVFTAPLPTNNEFVFDVIRGSTCAAPDSAHSNLTSYDWCVDGNGKDSSGVTIGEATCGTTSTIHCGPHDKSYLVRVHRNPTATGTCKSYTLAITAKGGGACDFSRPSGACDKQVSETP